MRWFWIDQFTEFVSGESATAVKNVSLAEEHLLDHFDGYPVMPTSLVIEGMAQTAGLLASQIHDFEELVVLAKVGKAQFEGHARPGDALTYRATIQQTRPDGTMVSVTSQLSKRMDGGERMHGTIELFFAHLDKGDEKGGPVRRLFEPKDLLRWLRVLGVFDVGRHPDGSKLEIPPNLAATDLALSTSDSSTTS